MSLRILLLPGHGGNDPGAVNPALDSTEEEEDFNLNIALAFGERLKAAGYEVEYSRTSDEYVSPSAQLAIIRSIRPDAAIAIHCNSSANEEAAGIETLYADTYDKPLAEYVQNALVEATGHRDRGVKKDVRNLAVLKDEQITAILVELEFISNDGGLELLRDTDTLADALFTGVEEWATR